MSKPLQGLTQQQLLEHPQLLKEFEKLIREYDFSRKNTKLPDGSEWKRNPVDFLKESGLWNPVGLREEMIKVVNHTSKLSSNQRMAVRYFGEQAIIKTIAFISEETKRNESEQTGEPESTN